MVVINQLTWGSSGVARWSENLHGQGVLLVTMRDSGVATEGADGLGRVPYGYGGFNQKKGIEPAKIAIWEIWWDIFYQLGMISGSVWKLRFIQPPKNAILRGEDYDSPVDGLRYPIFKHTYVLL